MSSINRVMMVGNIVSKPEVFETSGKKKYMKFKLETWAYKQINGDTRKLTAQHNVLVFNQKAHDFLEKTDVGTRIQLLGELGYDRQNNAEIVISAFTGEIGPMDAEEGASSPKPQPTTAQPSALANRPQGGLGSPMGRPGGMSKPSGMNLAAPTSAKAGGGLGRLSLKKTGATPANQEGDAPDTPEVSSAPQVGTSKKLMNFDSLDDEIPF